MGDTPQVQNIKLKRSSDLQVSKVLEGHCVLKDVWSPVLNIIGASGLLQCEGYLPPRMVAELTE